SWEMQAPRVRRPGAGCKESSMTARAHARKYGQWLLTRSRGRILVSAGVILTHPVGVNLTHPGNDGGFLATDNVESGASSGDQGNGASRRQHSGDGQAARLLTQHGQAIPA